MQEEYLVHHGILGQKWGIRRYQNEDGSLTDEGRARYGYNEESGKMSFKGNKLYIKDTYKLAKKEIKQNDKLNKYSEKYMNKLKDQAAKHKISEAFSSQNGNQNNNLQNNNQNQSKKTAIERFSKIMAAASTTAVATYVILDNASKIKNKEWSHKK